MLPPLPLHSSAQANAAARSSLRPGGFNGGVRFNGGVPFNRCAGWRNEVLRRLALSFLFVCAFVLSGAQEAYAAPIGMCAETAQSVEAPPPMFPADDAELSPAEDCQSGDPLFRAQEPGAPGDRLAPAAEIPDEKVILGDLVPVLGACSVPFALAEQAFRLPEEHRWRGLRPPRD